MATDPKWVLTCKACRAECLYAEIPADTESYFLPRKPQVPLNFTHKCGNCGHEDRYSRNDLSYRDESMPSRIQSKKCTGAEPSSRAAASGSRD
jgi:hypothetical protein